MWPKVINKVKVTHHGEGHIKVKVKYLHPFKFYEAYTLCQAGGLHSTQMLLVSFVIVRGTYNKKFFMTVDVWEERIHKLCNTAHFSSEFIPTKEFHCPRANLILTIQIRGTLTYVLLGKFAQVNCDPA